MNIQKHCELKGIQLIRGNKGTIESMQQEGFLTFRDLQAALELTQPALSKLIDKHFIRMQIDEHKVITDPALGVMVERQYQDKLFFQILFTDQAVQKLEALIQREIKQEVDGTSKLPQESTSAPIPATSLNAQISPQKTTKKAEIQQFTLPRFFTLLDTETTGLSKRDKVISYGYAHIDLLNKTILHQGEIFIDPEFNEHQLAHYVNTAYKVTQINLPGMWRISDAERSKFQRPDTLVSLINEHVNLFNTFVAHNMNFDKRMLNQMLESEASLPLEERDVELLCTMKLAKQALKATGKGESKLDTLCQRYNIDISHRKLHGALIDVHLTAEVIFKWAELGVIGVQPALASHLEKAKAFSGSKTALIDPNSAITQPKFKTPRDTQVESILNI